MTRLRLTGEVGRTQAKWLFLGTLLALSMVSGWLHRASAQRRDALDWREAPNALGLDLSASASSGAATFVWHLAPGAGPIVCHLDADGDGAFDHEVADCASEKILTHRYGASGVYYATLIAASRDGRAGIARAEVAVAVE
jgi:hypothetical protein